MKRGTWNLCIDALAATFMVGMLASGYVIRYPLPRGTHRFLRLWGMDRHHWGEIHFWLSMGLLTVLTVHMILHWQWVVSMVKRTLGGSQTPTEHLVRAGLCTVLVLVGGLALFAWIAHCNVVNLSELEGFSSPHGHSGLRSHPTSPLEAGSKVSLWTEVYPLFTRACLSCHGPDDPVAGFRVDRRQDFFRADGRKPFVVPGNSAASPLIEIVSGARPDMRQAEAHLLSSEEVALLKAWIDAGADWPGEPPP